MKPEDHHNASRLVSKAFSPPFGLIPLKLEFVLWEKKIPLGSIAEWKIGDVLSLNQAGLEKVELRVSGLTVGRGQLKGTNTRVSVILTDWPVKS